MNKAELVEAIAGASDLGKSTVAAVVDEFLKGVTNALVSGDTVALAGFGTFTVKRRAARMGRNPQTGEAIEIAASTVAGFKPAKALKEAVVDVEVD